MQRSTSEYFLKISSEPHLSQDLLAAVRKENRCAIFVTDHMGTLLVLGSLLLALADFAVAGYRLEYAIGRSSFLFTLSAWFLIIFMLDLRGQRAKRIEYALLSTQTAWEEARRKKFVLYLRSFKGEREQVSIPEYGYQYLKIEEDCSHQIRRAIYRLSSRILLIEASNFEDERGVRDDHSVQGFQRKLEVCLYGCDEWQKGVEELAKLAQAIIVQLDSFTPGVLEELRICSQLSKPTLILCENKMCDLIPLSVLNCNQVDLVVYRNGLLRTSFVVNGGMISAFTPPEVEAEHIVNHESISILLDVSWLNNWVSRADGCSKEMPITKEH